ncbi:MAG: glycosyltransferase family 2 protein [Lachnospiraceae bacterium]|nr:glycosyltransferase family 2 protein [Lachnospiraceae bacterium]
MLTIFTPAYNRAELLKRAYDSLKKQTCGDFCWLIVDDGSSDDTGKVVREFIDEGILRIEYHYQENGGKMRAHNRGVEYCKTDWFLCLDSDDHLTKTAVEEISKQIKAIEDNKFGNSEDIAGIIGHKGKSDTELLSGTEFPVCLREHNKPVRTTLYGLYLKGFKGETTLVFKTKVLREYPFPQINGEKYVPEDYIYDKIDQKYEYILLDRILTVCELVASGYTDSVRMLKENNVQAWYLYYEQRARITPVSILKLKYLGFYRLYAKMAGKSLDEAKDISRGYKLLGIPGEVILRITGRI